MEEMAMGLPEIEISNEMVDQLAGKEIGEAVKGTATYEVIGKSVNTARLRITNINFKESKRVKDV